MHINYIWGYMFNEISERRKKNGTHFRHKKKKQEKSKSEKKTLISTLKIIPIQKEDLKLRCFLFDYQFTLFYAKITLPSTIEK